MYIDDKLEQMYANYIKLQNERNSEVSLPQESSLSPSGTLCHFARIHSLTYEKDFPRLEAFENIVASINNSNCKLVYYLKGGKGGVEFYIGVMATNSRDELNSEDYMQLLQRSFEGNFIGSKIEKLSPEDNKHVIKTLLDEEMEYSAVLGVPSRNQEKEDISFQGVDRLINIMNGIHFHMLVIWEAVPKRGLDRLNSQVNDIYGDLVSLSKQSIQYGEQTSTQTGQSRNETKGINEAVNKNDDYDINRSTSKTKTKSAQTGTSHNRTEGESHTRSYEICNKVAAELVKYIDDELLPRIKQGHAKGIYQTSVYLGAELPADLVLLENSVTSIFQGNQSTFYPLHAKRLPKSQIGRQLVANFDFYNNIDAQWELMPLCSRPITNHKVGLNTWLTPSEISILAGMPQKDVPGLELREQTGFGLNVQAPQEGNELALGWMVQEGGDLPESRIALDRDDLTKHIFIAGTTGSGKTTTCHRLLHSSGLPFMVIEPAKTEYRVLLEDNDLGDIQVFTIGNEQGIPFRFNPFEFLQEETLSGHVDILKACFMASFDMEAAIPNLIEEALYKTYEAFGWDLRTGKNRFLKNREDAWNSNGFYFPTISDYIDILGVVVEQKGFDERLKNDYLGSIRARLDSLRTGIKGLILDTRLSVDFNELLNKKVILELEDLKSGEDKSFLMGLILGRMNEALKARHKHEPSYRHITLVEEAHRLLTRIQPGDSPNKKLGVEMFADLLAEVRKYGESLIIVDQIPSKLSPEVLKNTNTKIIHKLFAKDDKEIVGDTMALDDKQKNYLSHLSPGGCVVFSQGWAKPVHVQIEQLKHISTTDVGVDFEKVKMKGWKYWQERPWIYCPDLPMNGSQYTPNDFVKILETRDNLTNLFKSSKRVHEEWIQFRENVCQRLNEDGKALLQNFLLSQCARKHRTGDFIGDRLNFFMGEAYQTVAFFMEISANDWDDIDEEEIRKLV